MEKQAPIQTKKQPAPVPGTEAVSNSRDSANFADSAALPSVSDMCGATDEKNTAQVQNTRTQTPAVQVRDAADAAGNASCPIGHGSLPGECAPMAFPYVPIQDQNPVRYSRMEALETGTLFPGLNLPFKAAIQARTKLSNTALVELMALDFAIQELGLFLTTHPDDQEALRLYWSYLQLAKEGRERYQRQYGPLLQSDPTPEDGYAWLRDPWPWDPAGNP